MPELGKRAVACKGWRWLPGMRCTHRWTGGIRVLADDNGEQSETYVVLPDADGNAVMTIDDCGIMGGFPDAGSAYPFVPDLTDPATLGCLLALVREAWKDEGIAAVVASYDHENRYQWRVVHGHHHGSTFRAMSQKRYLTEAEALVAALEAVEVNND